MLDVWHSGHTVNFDNPFQNPSPRQLETWEKVGWTTFLTNEKTASENTRFILPNAWTISHQNSKNSLILWKQCRITRILWCLSSCIGSCSVPANNKKPETCFLIGKSKVAPIKQTSVPKLEIETAVLELGYILQPWKSPLSQLRRLCSGLIIS